MPYIPKYRITDELLSTIAEIEVLRTQISSSYILPEREIEMRYRATVEEVHSSTAIEGNRLNIKQVEKVLANGTPLTRHQYAELEVRNYKRALEFVDKRKLTGKPIELNDILTIHSIITDSLLSADRIGKLRAVDVDIINQDDIKLYDAPEASMVEPEIMELLSWLNASDSIHPVIAAAALHYQFVSIHPFVDGNGRTTRALTHLYLGLRKYDFRGALVLDSYYLADKQAYYNALHEVQGATYNQAVAASLDPWVTYFAEGFLSSAKVLSVEVTILSNVVGGNKPPKRINSEDVDLLSYAKQFGSISLAETEDILPSVPRRTLQRKLRALVDDGYLTISGNTRNTTYAWNENRQA
ncbi:MAG TPA: Fic family protein [Patescibacteria group bacterium]|nr:Fic family protein [Patescibacteria group bacterium]